MERFNFNSKIALFCSLMSFVELTVYLFLRVGFADQNSYAFKGFGFALFVFFLPSVIGTSGLSGLKNNLFFKATIFLPWLMIVLSVLGFLRMPGIVFSIAGYLFLSFFLFRFLRQRLTTNRVILFVAAIVLGFWVSVTCWGNLTLSATFIESMVAGGLGWAGWNGTDTLYHASLTQMIKTYGIPSTGIDGLPFTYYHFGSHFLFAQISQLLNIPVIDFYNIVYPIFFVPLLIYLMMCFSHEVNQLINKSHGCPTALILIITFYFLQLIKYHYSGGGLGNSFLISESTTISLLLLISVSSMLINYWIIKDQVIRSKKILCLFVALLILILLLGITKISTYFVFQGVLSYLFIRLKAYKSLVHNAALAINFLSGLVVLFLTLETLPAGLRTTLKPPIDSIKLVPFVFYKQEEFKAFDFFLFFGCSLLLFVLYLLYRKVRTWQKLTELFKKQDTLPIEVILASSLFSLFPTFILKLYPPNYWYFLIVQSFLSILLYYPYIKELNLFSFSHSLIKKYSKLTVGISLLVPLAIVSSPMARGMKEILQHNAQTRIDLTYPSVVDFKTKSIQQYLKEYTAIKKIAILSDTLMTNPYLKLLNKLRAFDRLLPSDKRKSMIYVDLSKIELPNVEFRTKNRWVDYSLVQKNWMIYCYDLPLLVPAISGLAMVDGMPCNCPNLNGHGYIFYSDKLNCEFNLEHAKKRARELKMRYLYFYDIKLNEFKKITLEA